MCHDAEQEDHKHPGKQRPWRDLLSQWRYAGCGVLLAFRAAEGYVLHQRDFFVVVEWGWASDGACWVDVSMPVRLSCVQVLPSSLCQFQTLGSSAVFQLFQLKGPGRSKSMTSSLGLKNPGQGKAAPDK